MGDHNRTYDKSKAQSRICSKQNLFTKNLYTIIKPKQ